jgi:hypothetical protein
MKRRLTACLLPFIFEVQSVASAAVAAFRVIWKMRQCHILVNLSLWMP